MLHLRRPVGAIVGRTDEIRSLALELGRTRLLSLIGPGGVGKTALAAELAHEVEPDFERAVAVELADAERPQDPIRLLSTAVLGAPSNDIGSVAASLAGGRTLVLIDNCEHLIDAVAGLVHRLLAAAPGATVVSTSRRPLGLGAETLWTVEPLRVPTGDDEGEVVRSPASQLLLERIYQAVPTFELTATNRPQVAEICRASDGVPLVLELAAALVRTTTLDDVLRAMTGAAEGLRSTRRDLPRHQRSIEASLDWSRRFLDPGDRELLDRLSVFVGGFTAEAAQAVEPMATRPALSRLCDHSLVSFDPTTGRYRILEVLRVDAAARLDPDDAEDLGDRHTRWSQTVVAAIEEARYEADPDNRFPRFEAELPNLCAAARRCIDNADLDRFRALLGPIAVWWVHYLPPDDPDEWSQLFDTGEAPELWRANITTALGFLASHRGDHRRALELAEMSVDLLERAGDAVGAALAANAVGNARLALGDAVGAKMSYRSGLAAARACGHPYPEMVLRVSLVRLFPGAADADRHLSRTAELARLGFGAIEAVVWTEQGLRALRQGDRGRAADLCDRAIERARSAGYPEAVAGALCGRADVAVADGDRPLADKLYRDALRIGRQAIHQGVIDQAAAGLAGLARAAEPTDDTGAGPTGDDLAEPLSDRELAVARLLRGDLTQREIADELYIAPSTVKTHIKSIYRKLGVAKRSHAITRAAELGLFER